MSDIAVEAPACSRCRGVGLGIKRITTRKDGSIATISYDLKAKCKACQGTGLQVMEVTRG
ncbi:hypothetical protein [Rhizobium sp. 18055]|uniref:hypothetical protein n=1 Tax=Rhizobium sp. 18055 TaxID=2681403 RepID=UPI00135C776C|nr:hypothetical protein [Rhizobium sp. 18055]